MWVVGPDGLRTKLERTKDTWTEEVRYDSEKQRKFRRCLDTWKEVNYNSDSGSGSDSGGDSD